jgi:anthranilate phosphoribosyltransferase
MRTYLNKVIRKKDLTHQEISTLLTELTQGHFDEMQIAAFLAALACKGITADELLATWSFFQSQIDPISSYPSVQVMGTGKTEKPFNISTCAAIIASVQIPILKVAARAINSSSGCADILEALGCSLSDLKKEKLSRMRVISPYELHPIFATVAPLRRSLQIPTLFDLCLPFISLTEGSSHLIGVFDEKHFKMMRTFIKKIPKDMSILCVYGKEGLDEFSISHDTFIIERKEGKVTETIFSPEQVGLTRKELLPMKNSFDSSEIILDILQGKESPYSDQAAINAGALLYLGGQVKNLTDGFIMAKEIIQSKKAFDLLSSLTDPSKKFCSSL